MTESLDHQIEEKFQGVTNAGLIYRIENSEAFGYDDEQFELSRRLKLGGQAWRFAQWGDRERVTIFPQPEQRITDLSEEELLAIVLEPGMQEDTYLQARDEYYRRRGDVIDRATEARRSAS